MDVLEKIDILRKERGWSVNYLALEAELTQSTLNNLYARRSEPKISTLRALCKAFGITLAEFFMEETEESEGEAQNETDELIDRVKALSPENKKALLTLLKNMK